MRAWIVGQAPEQTSTAQAVTSTLAGLALVTGIGAAFGWAIGRTPHAALVGALFGISAGPQVVSAIACSKGQHA